MLLSLNGKIRSGYVLAFVLLLVSYLLILHSTRQLRKETDFLNHGYIVLNKLSAINSSVMQVESSIRGYMMTKERALLDDYNQSRTSIPGLCNELTALVKDNPTQTNRSNTLHRLIDERLTLIDFAAKHFDSAGQKITPEIVANRPRSLQLIDSIHICVDDIAASEDAMMKKRKSNLSGFLSGTQTLTIISLLTAIIAILYSLATYNTENKAKSESQQKAIRYGQELEQSVSQLKDSNTELQELRSIEKFAATGRIARTMAHEVRNPLTNISLAAEQLNEMGDKDAEAKLLLDMISRNAVRINQLVADLLNATRFVQLDIQNVSVHEILDQTLHMAKDRLDLNNISVEKAYSQQPLIVAVDAEKIKLAFLNIVVNAIEAMEKGKGALRLKTRREGSRCVIEIRDNGIGMNEDTLSKLFEPYFTAKQKGNGLGLTNTQNIILNHKGTIKVISHPGDGTTFKVTLELAGATDGQEAK